VTERDEIQALRELVQQRTQERDALRQALEDHRSANDEPRPIDLTLYKVLGEGNANG